MLATAVTLCSAGALAQDVSGSLSLKSVPPPGPSAAALAEFVRDKDAAIQLGKALFWDSRVGSDNKTACASCHFAAGADNRSKNQVDPGLLGRFPNLVDANPDHTFQLGGAPNYTLGSADFPFTRHADVNDASSMVSDINDVASSQGVFTAMFKDVAVKSSGVKGKNKDAPDLCDVVSDAVFDHGDGFNINGVNTRRVEPRNTPTVINAVYNFRNFWDGRGNNVFNGGDPFGLRNPSALVWKFERGVLREVPVALASSSLASQGSGPPLSATEMSCRSRTFAKLGQKMLDLKILADQSIAGNDSVLGKYAGDRPSYGTLVRNAFQPAYWQAPSVVKFTKQRAQKVASMDLKERDKRPFDAATDVDVSQMEANFALFFGIAVQLYEATLIANDTPFDQHAEGKQTLTPQQLAGFEIFKGKGHCINCHGGAELTNASFRNVLDKRLEKMVIGDGSTKTYDSGFYNIGVRPTTDDIGVGGTDGFGNPLSESMMFAINKASLLGNDFDASKYQPTTPENVNVAGAFKAPSLRNVELTGPYFHNGGKATLMQVVDFYNRGGDFARVNRANLDPDIEPLHLADGEKENLVAFLLSLTDERVRYERAPFDHPSICLPHGHPGDTRSVVNNGRGEATEINPLLCIKEVGATGAAAPLKTFLGLPANQH